MSAFKGAVHQASDFAAQEWALAEFDLSNVHHLADTVPVDGNETVPDSEAMQAALRENEAEARRAQELADALADAYGRGFEDGRREGETGESARTRNAVKATERALDEIRAGETKWAGMIEENISALSIAIARQIVGRELNMDGEAIADLVRRALTEFPIDQPVRIRVNPLDLSAITTANGPDGQPLAVSPGRELRWQADASIAPGGCVVEGRDRIVDGRVDTALERLYRRLTYTNA
ncbi:MAG: FliH/SctL family protein [Gemmatimonadota bacterium]|nr:FliH/SctL family protein [Gemmatimonadota bacterium]